MNGPGKGSRYDKPPETGRLHEKLNCRGYFGFGGGWAASVNKGAPSYCNDCQLARLCWDIHRDRVRVMVPTLTATLDQIAEETGGGEAYLQALKDRDLMDAYLAVSLGNMEDGATLYAGGLPKDRGSASLTWPLTEPDW